MRFARIDGVAIAHQQWGEGPVDVVAVPPLAQNIELAWELPAYRAFFERLGTFARELAGRPEVRDVYLLGGTDDVLAHVQVADSDALRQFVIDHLSTRQEVAHTQTSLVFEHVHQPASIPPR